MSWHKDLQNKWITPALANDLRFDETFINMCALVARSGRGHLLGFTVFENRGLNEHFFQRLKLRSQSPDLQDATFELYFPGFLDERVKLLLRTTSLPQLKLSTTSFMALRYDRGHLVLRPKLRIVNVDDSPVLLKFLNHVFSSCGWIDVVAQIEKSSEAVDKILLLAPDVVTLDIQMPEKNGVAVVKDLLSKRHFPVLMISSLNLEEGSLAFEALCAGAFDYIQKPQLTEREQFKDEVLSKIQLAVEGRQAHASLKNLPSQRRMPAPLHADLAPDLVWCIGSSTGGTQALTRVFTSLPHEIPPTLVVQHMPPIYSKAFADSLNNLVPFTVTEAVHGEALAKNHVYIAPGGKQMTLEKVGGIYKIAISDDPPVNRFKPSVDYLFKRLSTIKDLRFIAGLLTGMGRDGADGLLALKNAGARTFAQDESSSSVYGMPRAAAEIGAAEEICHIDQVAQFLMMHSSSKRRSA